MRSTKPIFIFLNKKNIVYLSNMDVIAVKYALRKKKPQGADAPKEESGVSPVLVVVVLAAIAAAYFSFTSNTFIDEALTKIAPGASAGPVVNAFKAMGAMTSGFGYLLYYFILKMPRMKALGH
jgi:hypothetical protein